MRKYISVLLGILFILSLPLSGCTFDTGVIYENITIEELPPFGGSPYIVLEQNVPDFPEGTSETGTYEDYAPLDALGRCGPATAVLGLETMPEEERGAIGNVRPTGWHTVKYDFVDGKYLYNRCHLIAFMLAGENANERNLITGTRYMNVEGMLPFENMVADYICETGNHVLYRVTPVFEGTNLLASGVVMEARSVEDNGEGLQFYVYCYNVQPGVEIDYETGESVLEEGERMTLILNTNTRKIHLTTCPEIKSIKEKNKKVYEGAYQVIFTQGYTPCTVCNPAA